MRVLLVVPTFSYTCQYPTFLSITDFPVGLAYLASSLRAAGHQVFGLNANNDPNYASAPKMLQDKLARSIADVQPNLIALGGLCTDYAFLRDAMRLCRKLGPDTPVVCGGGIITHDSRFVFEMLRPDFCIVGEGEEAFVALAGALESDRSKINAIPNLGYWSNDKPFFTEENYQYPDLDLRPFPDYEPFRIGDMLDHFSFATRNFYRYPRLAPRPMVVVTARSCPFQCTFCVHERGPKYRARSITNVMQELEVTYDRYGFNVLIVLDELFAAKRGRLQEFCEAIIERQKTLHWDFDWVFQTHASAALTAEDMKMARAAGCYAFSYGMESASPRVLASMNKKTQPRQILDAITRARESRIGFGGNFIFGDVAETPETIIETMSFFHQHCREEHVSMGPIRPYPGTPIFQHCLDRGTIRHNRTYYEHVDGGLCNNMTSMPDALWVPWIILLESRNATLSWVPSVSAESCVREPGGEASPMLRGSTMFAARVTATCPYCGETVTCRELFDSREPGRHPWRSAAAFWLGRIIRICRHDSVHLLRYARQAMLLLLGARRKDPVFQILEPLRDSSAGARWVFATGCPHCNRRFRVKVSPLSA